MDQTACKYNPIEVLYFKHCHEVVLTILYFLSGGKRVPCTLYSTQCTVYTEDKRNTDYTVLYCTSDSAVYTVLYCTLDSAVYT